jgi:hypothetical protein
MIGFRGKELISMNLTEIVKDNILDIVIKYLKGIEQKEDLDINITIRNKELVIEENKEIIIDIEDDKIKEDMEN